MNAEEEKLQNDLQSGLNPTGDELDVRAYREVFRVLEKEPEPALSAQFSQAVIARIASRQRQRDVKDYVWFAAGIVFLALSFLIAFLFTGFRFDFDLGFLKGMAEYKGLVIFGVVFIAFLNWLDKKLVAQRRWSADRKGEGYE